MAGSCSAFKQFPRRSEDGGRKNGGEGEAAKECSTYVGTHLNDSNSKQHSFISYALPVVYFLVILFGFQAQVFCRGRLNRGRRRGNVLVFTSSVLINLTKNLYETLLYSAPSRKEKNIN